MSSVKGTQVVGEDPIEDTPGLFAKCKLPAS